MCGSRSFFGSGLPLLFPIALFVLCVLYATNRVTLAYLCRAPPIYDEKMNKVTVNLLKVAPLLYMSVGAWVYSNQQKFYDKVKPITNNDLFMDSNHNFQDFWARISPGTIFCCYILLVIISILMKYGLKKCNFCKCCCKLPLRVKDIQVI